MKTLFWNIFVRAILLIYGLVLLVKNTGQWIASRIYYN